MIAYRTVLLALLICTLDNVLSAPLSFLDLCNSASGSVENCCQSSNSVPNEACCDSIQVRYIGLSIIP